MLLYEGEGMLSCRAAPEGILRGDRRQWWDRGSDGGERYLKLERPSGFRVGSIASNNDGVYWMLEVMPVSSMGNKAFMCFLTGRWGAGWRCMAESLLDFVGEVLSSDCAGGLASFSRHSSVSTNMPRSFVNVVKRGWVTIMSCTMVKLPWSS